MESESNKLFVGGITHATSATNLRDYFSKYGDVKNVQVMRNRVTGTSRGFGFVSFSDHSSMERALQIQEHQILGTRVAVNIPRPIEKKSLPEVSLNQNTSPSKTNKIFVGGLPSSLTKEEFDRYFETFGRITDSVIMCNKQNNNPRGFGFVTYDSEKSVEKVVMDRSHQIGNKWVDVKMAIPRGEAPIKFYPHDSYQVSWGAVPFSRCYLRPAGPSIDGYYAYANQMASNLHYHGQQLWVNHPNFGFYPSYYYNTAFGSQLGNSYVDPTYMDYCVDVNERQGDDGPPSSGSSSINKSVTIQEAEDVENEASGKLNDEVTLDMAGAVENGASGKPDDEISQVVEAVSDCSSSEIPVVVDNGVSGMTKNKVSKVIVDGNGDVNGHASQDFTSVYDQY
ncbi:uncharacterized protein [Henckelia pumila]|uniref:uncharacterized protein n=1 Tax=Henckelia pumila TaxID=405737 RepID=UPI003C6E9448